MKMFLLIVFVKMLGVAGLHETTVQALRSLVLSTQSENTGGFVLAQDGPTGTTPSHSGLL